MIGVDISEHSIKIVCVTNERLPRYITHGTCDLPEGTIKKGEVLEQDVVRKALRDVLLKCNIGNKANESFVFSIPETKTFLRVIEIPQMQEDEISEAIKWEVAQHIPLGLENMYIDWQPITKGAHVTGTGRQEIQVGAAQRKLVDALYSTLKPFHFDVAAFELESQAIVRSLISPELRDKQGIVIVDLGGTATNVIVHDHGALRFTATLQKGMDDMLKAIDPVAPELVDDKNPKLAAVTDELASEVLSIAEFYASIDSEHVVREIVLTGGGANVPSLDAAFLRHFDNIHVQRGNPWVNLLGAKQSTKPPMDLRESVRYSTAIGLAMRPVLR